MKILDPLILILLMLFWSVIGIILIPIYLIAGIHDLIISDKVANGKLDKCPYFIEKGGNYENTHQNHNIRS